MHEGDGAEGIYTEARGSGIAAFLCFFHIALTGYLAFCAKFLIMAGLGRAQSAETWALTIYFPAAFAVFLSFWSDRLARILAGVCRVLGIVVLVISIWAGARVGRAELYTVLGRVACAGSSAFAFS